MSDKHLRDALEALLRQALQSELNTPAHEWGYEAIQGAIQALAAPVASQPEADLDARDLVARLRVAVNTWANDDWALHGGFIASEAADELERLSALQSPPSEVDVERVAKALAPCLERAHNEYQLAEVAIAALAAGDR